MWQCKKGPVGHQFTCAQQQQHFHYGVFLKGELQPDELKADLVHPLAELIHGRLVHLLSAKEKQRCLRMEGRGPDPDQQPQGAHGEIWVWVTPLALMRSRRIFAREVSCLARWLVNCLLTNLARLFIRPLEECQKHRNQPFSKRTMIPLYIKSDNVWCAVCDPEIVHGVEKLLWRGVKPRDSKHLLCGRPVLDPMDTWQRWPVLLPQGPPLPSHRGREMCLLMLCSNTFKKKNQALPWKFSG